MKPSPPPFSPRKPWGPTTQVLVPEELPPGPAGQEFSPEEQVALGLLLGERGGEEGKTLAHVVLALGDLGAGGLRTVRHLGHLRQGLRKLEGAVLALRALGTLPGERAQKLLDAVRLAPDKRKWLTRDAKPPTTPLALEDDLRLRVMVLGYRAATQAEQGASREFSARELLALRLLQGKGGGAPRLATLLPEAVWWLGDLGADTEAARQKTRATREAPRATVLRQGLLRLEGAKTALGHLAAWPLERALALLCTPELSAPTTRPPDPAKEPAKPPRASGKSAPERPQKKRA